MGASSRGKRRARKADRKRKALYSKGELNRLVDSLIHPLCEEDKRFILLDGFLHGLIEKDPPKSVMKFVKYNLPEILEQLSDKQKGKP
jgi:hypothetical protein